METIQSDLEASQDIIMLYRNLKYNNASDVNIAFGTDSTRIAHFPEKRIDKHVIKEYIVNNNENIPGSCNPHEFVEYFKNSSSIEPNLISFPKRVKFPINEISFDSLPTQIPLLKLDLQFSRRIENLIIHDSIFRRFISEIEISLNQIIEYEYVKLENKIYFEEDWEIRDYEKLILSLNFKEISFKREMLLWKMINNIVYNRIKSLILYSSGKKVKRIKELKKKFFIKLKM